MSEEEQEVIEAAVNLEQVWDNGKFKDRGKAIIDLRHAVRNLLLEDAEKWT
jgi:hypothetical protein